MKPAMLIRNAWAELVDFDVATEDYHALEVFLKLSQELSLTPGLLLPVALIMASAVGATNPNSISIEQQAQESIAGSIWVPKVVGITIVERGAVVSYRVRVHVDYEMVLIPFMDWFLHWDWLDNITDGSLEW